MSFSKNTMKLMNLFMDNFESQYLQIKDKDEEVRFNRIMRKLYNDILLADRAVTALMGRQQIAIEKKLILKSSDIPKTNLLYSSYVPEIIRYEIREKALGYINYQVQMENNKFDIYFLIFKQQDLNNMDKYNKRLKWLLMWLHVALSYAGTSYGKQISIYLYLTSNKKTIPTNKLEILNEAHCNSAVTTACEQRGQILIYREEEWFKVLIHETFHLLCLDFANMPTYILSELNKQIRSLMPIRTDYNLFESYSEFWASIMNSCFVSYYLIDKKTYNNFISYCDLCIQSEIIFSTFQMVKILNFMSLRYPHLYVKEEDPPIAAARTYLYREKTNVFAYYVVKCILLFFHVDFLDWCDIHNGFALLNFRKTRLNLSDYFKFIESKYKSRDFVGFVEKIEQLFKEKKSQKEIFLTTRMSVCEMKD